VTNQPTPIVVVRKKAGHAGHHGGAWKVAYADFVTAMMAFFLVLWLVGQGKEVKAAVGGYFRDPVAFEESGGRGVLPGSTELAEQRVDAPPVDDQTERERLEEAVTHIREALANVPAFKTLGDQVEFTVTPEGLRIDLLDRDNSSFFELGSAVLRPETERILGVIAHEIGSLEHVIVVEGHTDSHAYAVRTGYSNWELSADRANAARRVMERDGLRDHQVGSVTGLADRQLRIPDQPLDARNRRVSILVKSPLLAVTK
jgi:chemotaxis protein MotB